MRVYYDERPFDIAAKDYEKVTTSYGMVSLGSTKDDRFFVVPPEQLDVIHIQRGKPRDLQALNTYQTLIDRTRTGTTITVLHFQGPNVIERFLPVKL